MKAKDLREKSIDDLHELETAAARQVFDLRFKNYTNRLDDTSSIRTTRRELARIRTVLGEIERDKLNAPNSEAK
ncbi:MAG: 50S ribosomal protein L29 [Myxococcales bacterium]|jgi:large subunit ribosomal protein L29